MVATKVAVIDADAHVVETERTWDYLEGAEQRFRPALFSAPANPNRQVWVLDDQIRGFRFATLSEMEQEALSKRTGRLVTAPQAARDMDDIDLRLAHLDQLGIDLQILHNSFWISPTVDRPDAELALVWAWTRWMADIWRRGQGRLRWSCVLPYLSINEALDVLRFAHANGAVAVNIRGLEGERVISDPYFYPVYEEARRLDLAMVVHVGNGNAANLKLVGANWDVGNSLARFRLPVVMACHTLLTSELPTVFAGLRWGFIEASAGWAPWIVREAESRVVTQARHLPANVLPTWNVFITCETDDDVPYLIADQGEDYLMVGTDYGHFDPSSQIDAISILQEQWRDRISPTAMRKILHDNPKRLYGL